MKKFAFVVVITLVATGVLFAQMGPGQFGGQRFNQSQVQGKTVQVEGKLALINGMIGLKSGAKTYYVPMIGRLAGFIEGVKEGATIKVEGYENPIAAAPEYSMLVVTKLTFGGKDYDFSQFVGNRAGHGGRGGMMGGRRW